MHTFCKFVIYYALCLDISECHRRKTGLDDAANRGYTVNDNTPAVDNEEPQRPTEDNYEKTYVFSSDHVLVAEKNNTFAIADNNTGDAAQNSLRGETTVLFLLTGKFTNFLSFYLFQNY